MVNGGGWGLLLAGMAIALIPDPSLAVPQPIGYSSRAACPTDLEPLVERLIQDLPGYVNRVNNRSRDRFPKLQPAQMIVAGRPEFEPLPLAPNQPIPEDPTQVFITTLTRTYYNQKILEMQEYHWLFLTKTPQGWQLALMFSRTGGSPQGKVPSPPRESSRGAVGEAVRLWLRDCQRQRGVLISN